MQMSSTIPALQRSEWVFFFTLVALILCVFAVAKLTGDRGLDHVQSWDRQEIPQTVWVTISGHVKRPGKFKLRCGESLESVIQKAAPKVFADLSTVDLAFIPNKNLSIEILPIKTVRVSVRGCVKKDLDFEMGVGAKICDLKGLVDLSEEADAKFLRKKRKLRDGEVVEIPSIRKALITN